MSHQYFTPVTVALKQKVQFRSKVTDMSLNELNALYIQYYVKSFTIFLYNLLYYYRIVNFKMGTFWILNKEFVFPFYVWNSKKDRSNRVNTKMLSVYCVFKNIENCGIRKQFEANNDYKI